MYNADNFSFDDRSGILPVFRTQVHDQFKFMRLLYIFPSDAMHSSFTIVCYLRDYKEDKT